ncbi:hypothetical protein CEXT_604171 [Caerostris extrusa]|uniref:Uncharacterized protein n=1 Tax=Caerostris extrusa TaxID=172846 RepID=A0AAV4TVW4_CAEEX|nr:hypothetical protein CEXT_604171 [Caerostris extrusa]
MYRKVRTLLLVPCPKCYPSVVWSYLQHYNNPILPRFGLNNFSVGIQHLLYRRSRSKSGSYSGISRFAPCSLPHAQRKDSPCP